MTPAYAELHTLSNFTFLRGASHPEELVRQAIALGYTALALTDECSLAGAVRAWVAAKEAGLRFILGSEFTLETGERLVVLAPDATAYAELASLITYGRRQCAKGEYRLSRSDVVAGITRGLLLSVPTTLEQTTPVWLAEHFAEALPVRLIKPPFEMPALVEVVCWPRYLDHDPAHQWFRDTLLACAERSQAQEAMKIS